MSNALSQQLTALTPDNEPERLAALQRYNILDTPPEAAFDRITQLAARLFKVPTALISLVDESRAWFKSCVGFGASEAPRDNTLCSFAVLTTEPLIVPDARLDDRFACNPFVQMEPGVRFYAGAPLLNQDGFNLGTLCLLDSQPRPPLTAEQQATLVDLAAVVVDELELRLAAQNVAQSEEKYRTLFDSIDEGFCICEMLFDEQGEPIDYRFLEVNSAFERLTGLEQATGKRMRELAPNHEAYWFETYGRVVQTREPVRFENYASALNRWFNVNAFCVGEPQNNQFAVLFTNITETKRIEADRKQAEAILQQTSSELESQVRKFDATLSTIADSVFSFDRDARFLYANQVLLDVWGITAAEAIGKTMADLNYPTDVERQVLDDLQRVFETGEIVRNETPYTNPAGVEGYFEYSLSPVIAADRIVKSVVGLSRDISGRKQAEAALRESEELKRRILESSKDCIKVLTLEGQLIYLNTGGLNLLEIDNPASVLNAKWLDFWQDENRQNAEAAFVAAKAGNDSQFQGCALTAKGNLKWWDVIITPIRDASGRVGQLLSISRDITKQKQAESEQEQLLKREQVAREEAEHANRIKDEFLAVLSHELRSPLNPILGWTQLLQRGKLDANRQREALATIERNAKLQTQLIEDLLDISRIMQGKLSLTITPVSLTFVIMAAIETVRLAAEAKNIQILLDLTLESISVTGDAARLQQVVWNLLTNAVKFTPSGGQVTVELRQLDHLAQIRVVDTGKGINPQFLPYVFEYFRQADATTTRKFGGLGLGLAIVQQIIEMHGGTVWAESEGENRGAIFTVQLPINLQEQLSEPELPQDNLTTETRLSNLQILLVDDEIDAREFQTFLLEQSGARVTAVASGAEALQSLDRSIPDVLISDVGMAEMDGYMLIQQIRSRPHDRGGIIPAIALTAYARNFDQQKAIQSGFQTHITKPVEPALLIVEIAKLLKPN